MFASGGKSYWNDESGAVMVEVTVTIFTFLVILFGIVEFSYAFYQWNAATKAMQFGARLAAVSNPVSSDLSSWSGLGLSGSCSSLVPGDPIPDACGYDRVCTSSSTTGATGTCTNSGTYSANAMRVVVYGRAADGTSNTACDFTAGLQQNRLGMCNIFTRLNGSADRVQIRYQYTRLGYAGRPGGPVPTVTVSLTGMPFQFVLLNFMFGTITMPGFATTVTGEDLNPNAPT